MRKWAKLFITLHQEVIQEQSNRKKVCQERLIGFALLKKDDIAGKKYWVTWDGEGYNELIFEIGEPLVFPPDALQIGTRIHLLPSEE